MRLILYGDGKWAEDSLQQLLANGHEIAAVVLRQKPSSPGLADLSRKAEIPSYTFDKVNADKVIQWVRSLAPELNVSVSYDQILRRPILQSAPRGFINVHGGKLPYYRGRNIINWAIINNEPEIGVTVHYVDEGIDTGDIILQECLPINWEDTYGDVLAKVEKAIPGLVARAVHLISRDEAPRQPQAHLEGTYFCRRLPGDEWIDWRDSSLNIYNKIRAITQPGPGATTTLNGRRLVIWSAEYDRRWPKYVARPGEVVGKVENSGIRTKTGDSTITVKTVQWSDEKEETVPRFQLGTRFELVHVL